MELAIVVFNTASLICFVIALALLLLRTARKKIRLEISVYLSFICCIFIFVNISNIVEHLGITSVLDFYEDYAELLVPLLFIGFVNSARLHMDIDRLKRNEQQLDAMVRDRDELLKEVHHRVKNNLQVVLSIIALRRRQKDVDPRTDQILMATESRVFSMAAVHEVIYRFEHSREIPVEEFSRTIVNRASRSYHAGRTGAVQVNLQINAELRLRMEKAVPFGLLVNELISNAYRHAFPPEQPGEVTLRLAPAGREIVLEVHDNGRSLEVGEVPGEEMGMSRTIIRNLIAQLDGTAEETNDRGNRIVLRFAP